MSTLDLDFEILCDDYDRLVALEALGVKPDFPAVCAISQRWGLTDDDGLLVATESREMMEQAQFMTDTDPTAGVHRAAGRLVAKGVKGVGKLAGKGAAAAGRGTVNLSKKLAGRFYDFAEELAKEQADRLKDATSKAAFMERKLDKLKKRMSLLDDNKTMDAVDVHTSSWTSKVCYEDKVDFEACLTFSKQTQAYEGVVQKYTVYTRTALKKSQFTDGPGMKQIGRSTSWAVKRAAGLMGIVDPFKKIEAYPIPGNIIVVTHHSGKVGWAIAREGQYGETIKSLDMHQCGKAIEAVDALIKSIRDRGTKSRVFGYTGIYAEVETMKGELKDLEGKELRVVTQRYRNALAMEDAFTTALVRVAEGLMEWIKQSLAEVH
ncbi:hypothetical protein pEaSNUABM29_00059 [Erwinia phage pEa_SNUABM_29]|nr:hypothetical protein pEaSNUABM29_00059 [Erwinia phage pEa_SNUABM_29]